MITSKPFVVTILESKSQVRPNRYEFALESEAREALPKLIEGCQMNEGVWGFYYNDGFGDGYIDGGVRR